MDELIRPELRSLKPYEVTSRSGGVWLNANESPWDKDQVIVAENINRYPEAMPQNLIEQLASVYQIESNQLLLTQGSDEGIDILVRLFCCPYQDEVIVCPPTFGMYKQSAILQGAKLVEVPLLEKNDYQLDFEKIKNSITNKTKILFLCSPNNPTGNLIPSKKIRQLVESLKGKVIVVVDEAYIEFSHGESMSLYINQYNNLVVLRTLSKAFGLAGLRCGSVISQTPLIERLHGIMPPYPFSIMALNAIQMGTSPAMQLQIKDNIAFINRQRTMMEAQLEKINIVTKVFKSSANFIFIAVKNAKTIFQQCALQGVYLRDFKESPNLSNTLRVSIGLEAQNLLFLSILKRLST